MSFPIGFRCHLVAILGPNFPISGPTWPPKPPKNRSKFIVWNHPNLHVRSRCDIDRFFIDFRTLELSKNTEKQFFYGIFAFSLPSLLRSILLRTWSHFGLQNRAKICPKRVFKGVENHIGFTMPSWAFKNQVFCQHGSNMARFCSPRWLQVGLKIKIRSEVGSGSDFEPILDPT